MSNITPNKIIESALVSEKSSLVGQNANTYVFKVNTSATKNQVKKAIEAKFDVNVTKVNICLLYTSPSPRDRQKSRMPSSA